MDTKEAIEFCDEMDNMIDAVEHLSNNSRNEIYRNFISLRKLLKRGEKYEKMWEGLKNGISEFDRGKDTLGEIYKLEQRYFPKEADNET